MTAPLVCTGQAGPRTSQPAGPHLRLPWDSDELSRAVGVEPPSDDQRHTALGDARWARDIYDAITNPKEIP